jgi:hypothetical protein
MGVPQTEYTNLGKKKKFELYLNSTTTCKDITQRTGDNNTTHNTFNRCKQHATTNPLSFNVTPRIGAKAVKYS